MKKEQIIRACLIVLILIGTVSGFLIGKGYEMSQSISLDTLEERVFEQYGEGDAGVEQMLFLKTGVHQDFMGRPRAGGRIAEKPDYIVCLHQEGTLVYDIGGNWVTFVPFDSCSLWDNAMMADNL